MRLMGKRKYKFMALLILAIILFVLLAKIFIYMNYKPVKDAVGKSEVKKNETYIICEYIEVTGFSWAIVEDNNEKNIHKYVKLIGNDPQDIFSDDILYGENKFVLYGNYVENQKDELLENEDYFTFYVKDWEILKPVKRLTKLFRPIDYLYNNDFVDQKYKKEY